VSEGGAAVTLFHDSYFWLLLFQAAFRTLLHSLTHSLTHSLSFSSVEFGAYLPFIAVSD
jgi:hypothetical protein